MVQFFIVALGTSVAAMALLLALKRYELNSGRIFFGSLRPRIDTFFHHSLLFFERALPALLRALVERTIQFIVRGIHRLVAQVIVFVEYWLQRTLDFLHMTNHAPHPTTPASAFLREIAEHKKTLLAHTRRERVIVHD